MASNLETLVTVFGGSGFLGRNVVRALAKREYRIRVAVRRPELAGHLQPLGRVGQIHAVQANLRYPASVEAAMRDTHVAINLVGILQEGGAQTLTPCGPAPVSSPGRPGGGRADGAYLGDRRRREIAVALCPRQGRRRAAVRPPRSATILRPSVIFGPEDQFTNRFAAMARCRRRCR
jgi:NADH dehydrogenase